MKISRFIFLLILTLSISSAATAQNRTPIETVKSFYAFQRTHSTAFTRATVDARKKWFSPALYALFLNELKLEKEFLKTHPGEKPFLGEGLPFQPWDELCTVGRRKLRKQPGFKQESEDGKLASVKVTFAFPSPCQTPDANEYTLELVKSGEGWLIDNVIYDSGSSLVKDLNRAEY